MKGISAWAEEAVRYASYEREVDRRQAEAFKAERLEDLSTDEVQRRRQIARKRQITRAIKKEVAPLYGYRKPPKSGPRHQVSGAQGSGKSHTVAKESLPLCVDFALTGWSRPSRRHRSRRGSMPALQDLTALP